MQTDSTWEKKPLGDLCDFINGYAFKPSEWKTLGKPIIRIQNLNKGQDFNYYQGVLPSRYEVRPGTLLFAWSGNRGTSFGPFVWQGPTGLLNQHIFKVIPGEGINENWIFYALDEVRQRVERDAHGASGLVHVRKQDLCKYTVYKPELSEQCTIATILDTMDEAIRQTEAVIAKLRQVKAGMLHDLLTRGLDENRELRDPIRHPEQFKDSPVGLIPTQWEVKGILEVAPIVEGQVDPRISPFIDFPLVAPDHIESGTGRLLSLRTAGEQGAISGKYRFQSGDVIYSKIRPYLRKAYLASFEGICSADMYPFRPTLEMNSQFLLMTLLSERFSSFASSVSERSGFPKINRKEVSLFYVALPETKEQNRISQVIQSIEQKLMTEQILKDKLVQLKQGLMHDLLTGTVRVPQHLQPDKATVADTEKV